MFPVSFRVVSRLLAVGASMGLVSAAALATNVPAGGTLNPCPGAGGPTGTTVSSGSVPFNIHYNTGFPNFQSLNTTGHVSYSVVRLADNTLTFYYSVTDDSTSDTVINHYSFRDFNDFSTDVAFQVNQFINLGDTPDSATRSSDGNTISFFYDLGMTGSARSVWIKTDATSFDLRGHSTLWMFPSSGSLTIAGVPRPVTDSTPPVVSISSPTSFADLCSPAAIIGTASDTGGLDHYDVEYAASVNGPWTLINTSTTPVSNGTLAVWNTNSPVNVAQGYYFIRVTAINTSGLVSSVTSVNFVDKQFDTVDLRAPGNGNLLGGGVCFDGTISDMGGVVNYTISYAPLPAGSPFLPVNPATPTYPGGVVNDGLGSWITNTGPAAVADGNYRVRVTGTDPCGFTRTVTRDITIDNTAPVATLSSPTSCSNVNGNVVFTGTVSDLHLAGWALQYTGGAAHGWVTIASGSGNINNGTIGVWNTTGLAPCAYTVRLVASDSSGINCSGNTNQTEYYISVNVGCQGDFNRSGGVSVQDIFDFLSAYFAGCP